MFVNQIDQFMHVNNLIDVTPNWGVEILVSKIYFLIVSHVL